MGAALSVALFDSFGLESDNAISCARVLGLCAEFLEHLDEGPIAHSAVAKLGEHPLEVFGVDEVIRRSEERRVGKECRL